MPDRDLTGDLTDDDRLNVAALWVTDGIHARHTGYPESSREVQYLKLSRSAWLRSCYNLSVVSQLCATFLDSRNCDHDNSKHDYNFLHPDGSPTRLTLTVFDLACLVLYLYDLFLVFAVYPTSKSLLHKPWSAFRLFICMIVFLDCLLYFTGKCPLRDPTPAHLLAVEKFYVVNCSPGPYLRAQLRGTPLLLSRVSDGRSKFRYPCPPHNASPTGFVI
jgi:hypothetical protein